MVLVCAVLVASVGLSFAQSNSNGQQSDAYNQGYMAASRGDSNSVCESKSVRNGTDTNNQKSVDCYKGWNDGTSDKKNAEQGNYNSNNR